MHKSYALLLTLILASSYASAKINFGDKNAGIKLGAGATLNVDSDLDVAGTITKKEGATITGSGDLVFDGGVFDNQGTESKVTGLYDPTTDKILLNGNKNMRVQAGTVVANLEVSSTGNVLYGDPLFDAPITLVDSDSALSIGIQTELTQQIILNSGTVTLLDNLAFSGSTFFTGPGTVNSNTRILYTGHETLTANTDLTFADTTHITLHAPVALSSVWQCNGEVCVNGNGMNLDLATTGQIVVGSDSTLILTDMQIKNWATTGGHPSIRLTDGTSTLRLENVQVRFTDDITYTAGIMQITGDTSFTLKEHQLIFDSASLVVDGATLSYDTVEYEFADVNSANITIINHGELNDVNSAAAIAPLNIDEPATLTSNFQLDPFNKIDFSLTEPGSLAADFAGHDVIFSNTQSTQMVVNSGVDATMSNVVIHNFVPQAISIAETGSLTFGNSSRVELSADQILDKSITFAGPATLDGNGHTLTISDTDRIKVADGGTLTIKDITLRGVDGTALDNLANASTIILENVIIELAGDAALAGGAWQVKQNVTVLGGNKLSYTSTQTLTIQTNATFAVTDGSTLAYDPADNATALFQFAGSSAKLLLANSTFEIADTGALLTKGTMVINDTATINSLATNLSGALVLGDGSNVDNNVTVKIGPRATLAVMAGVLHIQDA